MRRFTKKDVEKMRMLHEHLSLGDIGKEMNCSAALVYHYVADSVGGYFLLKDGTYNRRTLEPMKIKYGKHPRFHVRPAKTYEEYIMESYGVTRTEAIEIIKKSATWGGEVRIQHEA